MSFVLTADPTFKWRVTFSVPVDGRQATQSFLGEFIRISHERLEELGGAGGIGEAPERDSKILREVLIGWEDVKDADGEEVPFTPSTMEMLLNWGGVPPQILKVYIDAIQGAKRKN